MSTYWYKNTYGLRLMLIIMQQRPPAWLLDYAYSSVLSVDVSKSEDVDDLASVISPDGQRTFTLAEV